MMILKRKHIVLVVDDDEDLLQLFKDCLQNDNIEVKTANSVLSGIKAVETSPVSLVVLDWTFRFVPSPNEPFQGLPVLTKTLQKNPLIPVIVISSYQTIDVPEIALSHGASSFFRKPLQMNTLKENVNTLLYRFEAASSRFQATSVEQIKSLEDVQYEYVKSVVNLLDGKYGKAAEKLGVTRQTVAKILKERVPETGESEDLPNRVEHLEE